MLDNAKAIRLRAEQKIRLLNEREEQEKAMLEFDLLTSIRTYRNKFGQKKLKKLLLSQGELVF